MRRRVGIVTITGGSNYGNKLQHYAVVQILQSLGYEADTVRDTTVRGFADSVVKTSFLEKLCPSYVSAVVKSRLQYRYHRKNESDGYLKCILREKKHHAEFCQLEKLRQKRFDAFTEKYLPFGELTVGATQSAKPEIVEQYTAFVCGSDQVWNPVYRDTSPVRFLTFAPENKRIALSPSFGVQQIPESRVDCYREMLQAMAHLSVRESSGQRIIRELTGREAPVLIDPTLMLSAEEWEKIATKPNNFSDEPFLLTYFLGNKTRKMEGIIRNLAKEHQLRVVNLLEISEKDAFLYDPAEFLWLVQHAQFICTDSFHGTVFSILFRKVFYTFARSESGFAGDSRVKTLLDKLQLSSCIYDGTPYRVPDYEKVHSLLEQERQLFRQYLEQALQTASMAEKTEYSCVSEWNQHHPEHCSGCGACEAACPTRAIRMQANAEGFRYPCVDTQVCIRCKKCVRVCEEAEAKGKDTLHFAYACQNREEQEREKSSSGGVFIALAKDVLSRGGVVFGAGFDEAWYLGHRAAESLDEARAFMGSKYLQSDTKATFEEVKAYLTAGREVLYTGTPCQIGGLKAFLGREYSNLLTVDFICHGTPSPKAWDAYRSEKNLGRLQSVSFRSKDSGWANFSMKLCGENGVSCKDLSHDSYLRAFLANANLRDSCYQCRFKTVERCADLTIADFWGVARVLKRQDDDRGISLLLVNSQAGEACWRRIQASMIWEAVERELALRNNHAALHSVLRPQSRELFYPLLQEKGFTKTVKELLPITMQRRKYLLKERLSRIKHNMCK